MGGDKRWRAVLVIVALIGLLAHATSGAIAGPPRTITADDDGRTIDLVVGEQVLLLLGTADGWAITVDDPTVLGRVATATLPEGVQGLFEARRAGTTALRAIGEPPCRKSTPPCGLRSRSFGVRVRVATTPALPGLPNTGGGHATGRGVTGAIGLALVLLLMLFTRRKAWS